MENPIVHGVSETLTSNLYQMKKVITNEISMVLKRCTLGYTHVNFFAFVGAKLYNTRKNTLVKSIFLTHSLLFLSFSVIQRFDPKSSETLPQATQTSYDETVTNVTKCSTLLYSIEICCIEYSVLL